MIVVQSFPCILLLFACSYSAKAAFTIVSKVNVSCFRRESAYLDLHRHVISSKSSDDDDDKDDDKVEEQEVEDTIRVRIWRALATGDELTLKKLGSLVGERQLGDLKDHLSHVEKQAKTLKNKSQKWRERRGLSSTDRKVEKLRLITRRGKKNTIFIKLG